MTAVACVPVAETTFLPPDVLVLASGGTLGEAWMSGVLAGIEDATGHDFRTTESFVGTAAGSLVAAALVAGQRPRRPRRRWRRWRSRSAPAAAPPCGLRCSAAPPAPTARSTRSTTASAPPG